MRNMSRVAGIVYLSDSRGHIHRRIPVHSFCTCMTCVCVRVLCVCVCVYTQALKTVLLTEISCAIWAESINTLFHFMF